MEAIGHERSGSGATADFTGYSFGTLFEPAPRTRPTICDGLNCDRLGSAFARF
jgi:hypothetical protein